MKKSSSFDKFINPKTNAKKKEEFRQEKRKAKKDMKAYGDDMRSEKASKSRGDEVYKPERKRKYDAPPARQGNTFRKREKKSRYNDSEDLAYKLDKMSVKEKDTFSKSAKPQSTYKKSNTSTERKFVKKGKFAEQHSSDTYRKNSRTKEEVEVKEQMPLNKYIAHSGVCGRREAAKLVKQGLVKVNNDIVYEPGYKVSEHDSVYLKEKKITLQEKLVYVIMNKPKDHITTMDDEKGRKTVLDLVKNHIDERIYPVGRLDRNTTGVLLLTNDGELAQKLTHPSFEVKKIYEVTLDKALSKDDAEKILQGVELEDGLVKADSLGYADIKDKKVVGIELHSGKNHIVKRIFMHFGYSVTKLDRVMFANLTKKNVERGKWRFLNEREVRSLKSLNQGGRFAGKKFMK